MSKSLKPVSKKYLNTTNKKNWLYSLVIPAIFLFMAIFTMNDYGLNWDEPIHFMRGQAYLNFFLTGGGDFGNLQRYPKLNDNCEKWVTNCNDTPSMSDVENFGDKSITYAEAILKKQNQMGQRRSYYQNDTYTYDFFVGGYDGGHPPTNGIFAALFNFIFFQKLGILGDLYSYHLFEVMASFLLVAGVSIFTYFNFGLLSSVVSSLSISLYPLFFSESHFNIKDPIEASFYGLTIIFLYFGIVKKKTRLIYTSAIFAGLALGTKFNILFLPFIVIPWIIFYFFRLWNDRKDKVANFKKFFNSEIRPFILPFVLYPAIVFVLFFVFWPYLWSDFPLKLQKILGYYEEIGTSVPPQIQKYILNGWNAYPLFWILITTPLPIVFFTILGIIKSIMEVFRKNGHRYFLILLWFLVPIMRVSIPKTAIYGGVRQIMEFLPAMAVLSGVGALWLYSFLDGKKFKAIVIGLILFSFMFVGFEVIKFHPNENVYFNQLIGGLSGAKKEEVPSWGNSYGNAYKQGVDWINKNADENSKLALAVGTMGNIPRLDLRPDILFYNGYWSGPEMNGEYVMELSYDWSPTKLYRYSYLNNFSKPVFEVKEDGVSILKIWKNDPENLKEGYGKVSKLEHFTFNISGSKATIDLGKVGNLTKLIIKHSLVSCNKISPDHLISVSDNGKNWRQLPEAIGSIQIPNESVNIITGDYISTGSKLIYLFPGTNARYVSFDLQDKNACILKNPQVEIYSVEEN